MHRLLVSSAQLDKSLPQLGRDEAKHLKVLRPENGERFELFDGKGCSRVYRYDFETGALAAAEDKTFLPRSSKVSLVLFACVTKGSRWDWTIEKATELGVARIVPVISDRTIVRIRTDERAAKRERWLRIAEDAARQSDAKWIPEVIEAVDFNEAVGMAKATTCFVGALTDPPSPMIGPAVLRELEKGITGEYSVFIGPEGDFTSEELSTLIASGIPVSFGSTILRAETAAIYGLSAIKSMIDGRVR